MTCGSGNYNYFSVFSSNTNTSRYTKLRRLRSSKTMTPAQRAKLLREVRKLYKEEAGQLICGCCFAIVKPTGWKKPDRITSIVSHCRREHRDHKHHELSGRKSA